MRVVKRMKRRREAAIPPLEAARQCTPPGCWGAAAGGLLSGSLGYGTLNAGGSSISLCLVLATSLRVGGHNRFCLDLLPFCTRISESVVT